jgi:hypothetical protein
MKTRLDSPLLRSHARSAHPNAFVAHMAFFIPQETIASHMGISVSTLRRKYRPEVAKARIAIKNSPALGAD